MTRETRRCCSNYAADVRTYAHSAWLGEGYCPYCNSDNIDHYNTDYVDTDVEKHVYICNNCSKKFTEVYTMRWDYTEWEVPNKKSEDRNGQRT